jgi:hypothetical protein
MIVHGNQAFLETFGPGRMLEALLDLPPKAFELRPRLLHRKPGAAVVTASDRAASSSLRATPTGKFTGHDAPAPGDRLSAPRCRVRLGTLGHPGQPAH